MIIRSILDTDYYKLSMGSAIAQLYPRATAEYEFINRGNTKFPDGFAKELRHEVDSMSHLTLQKDEEQFLRNTYLNPTYIDMLRSYTFDPTQVITSQINSNLHVKIRGPWYQTDLWEVPLLSIISELYYQITKQPANSSWTQVLTAKLKRMSEAGCRVSDFGTRRRHSYAVQNTLVKTMKDYDCCIGTSNLDLAHQYGLTPIGTMAHEWIMAHACMFGYQRATTEMLKAWVSVYEGELGIALPDTFTLPVFLRSFGTLYAKLFDGIRQDSGDPKWFTDEVVEHYRKLGIDSRTKTVVYSDALTDLKAIEIQKYAENKVQPRFGIGTALSNDVGCVPLNIVIKMTKCNGIPAVKLSDSPGKETGLTKEVDYCKYSLGITD